MKGEKLSWQRIQAIAQKEKNHILRDPFTWILALGLPVFLVAVFGLAIDLDVKNIRLLVDDRDQSFTSRTLIQAFRSTGLFLISNIPPSAYPEQYISSEQGKGVLIIEPELEKRILSGQKGIIQIALDGADNSTVGSMLNYLGGIQEFANRQMLPQFPAPPVKLVTRFLYNPELNSRKFIVPGLVVVVIAIVSILLTALTVAREWENGSMELLLSTPVRPIEIILGKIFPYSIICLISVLFIYLLARIGFHIPFRGNHFIFLVGLFLFICACLAQGLVISVVTRKQLISMQLSMVSGLLPTMLLSGFIFPIESMPRFFQILTGILPPRWFMEIARDSFLKGPALADLKIPFLILLGINVLLIFIATKNFKRDLSP
jgi:ABC-2 type transport system permease protein